MADKFTPEKRSKIMSAIKGKNTSIEVLVFRYLRKEGVYFQKHYKKIIGNPDIALPRKKRAVFIDGDFWHGHTFERRKDNLPPYWINKIMKNIKRDRKYRKELRDNGWKILRVWESELIRKRDKQETLEKIKKFLIEK